ncbi:transcription elongation factor GreA [symbiont of Argiope bruennichi]|uniref:transcription elongation factor GreA n=1 Tax=symbiont of Argiope bruennichi TaxID=2810479 RepID=UPI003DA5530C
MNEKIILTQEGFEKLQKEYNELINVVRPKVILDLQNARIQGDLKENADYDAAKSHQAEVESRIKELEVILEKAEIFREVKNQKNVSFGKTVLLHDFDLKSDYQIKIVGETESDPFSDPIKISYYSDLAKSLLEKKEKDIIFVKTVKKPYKVKILKIYE